MALCKDSACVVKYTKKDFKLRNVGMFHSVSLKSYDSETSTWHFHFSGIVGKIPSSTKSFKI